MMNGERSRLILLAGFLSFTTVACVSPSAHQRVQDDIVSATQQAKMLVQELDAQKKTVDEAAEQLKSCEARVATAQRDLDVLKNGTAELVAKAGEANAALAEAQTRLLQADARVVLFKSLSQQLQSQVKAGQLELVASKGRMLLRFPEAVLFEAGKPELRPESKMLLTDVAGVLKGVGRGYQVEVHHDNQPLKKNPRYTTAWELTSLRALEVGRALLEGGLPSDRVSASAFGDHQPLLANDTAEHQARNRRIEVVVLPTLDELPSLSELVPVAKP